MENVMLLWVLDAFPEDPVLLNDFLLADIYTTRRALTNKARDASATADSSVTALTKQVTGVTEVTITTYPAAGGLRP